MSLDDAEEMLYFRLMLGVGETEAFDAALSACLNGDAPYDELTLALADCGKDHAAMVAVLQRFLQDGSHIDLPQVQARLRGMLYARYCAGPPVSEIIAMGVNIDDTANAEYGADWYGFLQLEEQLDLLEDGIMVGTPESCCERYLRDGRIPEPCC